MENSMTTTTIEADHELPARRLPGCNTVARNSLERARADDEVHLMLSAGVRWSATERLALSLAANLEYHDVSYVVTDRVSGSTGTVDSQTPIGFTLAAAWSFQAGAMAPKTTSAVECWP
jgi:hypothetical protein